MSHYDLDLFLALNEEYRQHPLVPRPRRMEPKALMEQASRRAKGLDRRLGLRGRRVLEIGCGRGHLGAVLAEQYDCKYTGVDVVKYDEWFEFAGPHVEFLEHDVTQAENRGLGEFDRILSIAVFEHIERPYEGISAISELLSASGCFYMSANLYRGPKASHRYREVFFPFPHLLFSDEVFAQFYERTTRPHRGPAWVNKLTAAQYRERVARCDLKIDDEWTDRTALDEAFFHRFQDTLGKYPKEDLETDFIHIVGSASKGSDHSAAARHGLRSHLRRLVEAATTRVGLRRDVRNST